MSTHMNSGAWPHLVFCHTVDGAINLQQGARPDLHAADPWVCVALDLLQVIIVLAGQLRGMLSFPHTSPAVTRTQRVHIEQWMLFYTPQCGCYYVYYVKFRFSIAAVSSPKGSHWLG